MAPSLGRRPLFGWLALALAGLAVLLAQAPGSFGASSGMLEGVGTFPAEDAWLKSGCVNCHGAGSFAPAEGTIPVTMSIADEDGPLTSGAYEADHAYTITIVLDEQNAPTAGNRAGFNLRVTAGELSAEGHAGVQVSQAHTQAAHTDATRTTWTVGWTAPHEGAVLFDLFVNDVDGDAAPDDGDHVYRLAFALTDHEGAQLGAAVEHEVHVGVPLPQYWLGLIALAGMVGVVIFGYVYIKYMSPHHTDAKDR